MGDKGEKTEVDQIVNRLFKIYAGISSSKRWVSPRIQGGAADQSSTLGNVGLVEHLKCSDGRISLIATVYTLSSMENVYCQPIILTRGAEMIGLSSSTYTEHIFYSHTLRLTVFSISLDNTFIHVAMYLGASCNKE